MREWVDDYRTFLSQKPDFKTLELFAALTTPLCRPLGYECNEWPE